MAIPPRCGQFTFYFSKCSHATTHLFHLSPTNGLLCNDNCSYSKSEDYWFYSSEKARCSFCGLGKEGGFGTRHPIPRVEIRRQEFFEQLMKDGKLGGADRKLGDRLVGAVGAEVYQELFVRAAVQYNRMVDACAVIEGRTKSNAKLRMAYGDRMLKKQRFLDRWHMRKMRAKIRTEKWVINVRAEQYRTIKSGKSLGGRPFILASKPNYFADFETDVSQRDLPEPMDSCIWCQFPLNEFEEGGGATKLPCGHMYHRLCITELFLKRAEVREDEVFACPLCRVWFQDVRELPDFYERYRDFEHEFDSKAASSEISLTECGDHIGDWPPPWLIPSKTVSGSRVNTGVRRPSQTTPSVMREEDSIDLNEVLTLTHFPGLRDIGEELDPGRRDSPTIAMVSGALLGSETDESDFLGRISPENSNFTGGLRDALEHFTDQDNFEIDSTLGEISNTNRTTSEDHDEPPRTLSLRRSSRKRSEVVQARLRRSPRRAAPPMRWSLESGTRKYT